MKLAQFFGKNQLDEMQERTMLTIESRGFWLVWSLLLVVLLGEKLLASDIPLVVIETSRTRVDELRERGVRAVLGNAANEEIMQLAHLECAKWLILTIPNGYEAGEIVASARAKNPDIEIIARAHYDDEVAYITERGANQVVMGEREIARTMLELLETPPAGEVVTG